MVPNNRLATHPGEILQKEFLSPKDMTQIDLANAMGVPIQLVNTIVKGKRSITARTAIKLSKVFKNSPEFWMNLQTAYNLSYAQAQEDNE